MAQAESLTSRLRTILDMYPDGNPILSGDYINEASIVLILIIFSTYLNYLFHN